MPAPPPLSEPATVNAMGVRSLAGCLATAVSVDGGRGPGQNRFGNPAGGRAGGPVAATVQRASRNRSRNRLYRVAVWLLRTAMASAFFEPIRTTSRLPRVNAV